MDYSKNQHITKLTKVSDKTKRMVFDVLNEDKNLIQALKNL